MAVYFDHRLENAGPSGVNSHIEWYPGGAALLAVASYSEGTGGTVNIFSEEGEKIQHRSLTNQKQVCALAWHPSKKILAVGWQSGELTIWSEQENELIDPAHIHHAEIAILCWSSNGARLASGDKAGLLIIWRSDSRGRLGQDPPQHHLQEPLAQICLHHLSQEPALDIVSLARAAVSGDEAALDMFTWKRSAKNGKTTSPYVSLDSVSFFLGGATGGVYHVNENAQCTQCFNLGSTIIRLLYYKEKNILITITESLLLTQHAIFPAGETKELLKVKLSGRPEEPSITWAGNGILAIATGETVIRLWDLEHDDNYVLSLEGNTSYNSSETLLCAGYSAEKGMLAGGTNMGNIALWQYIPSTSSKRTEGENQWMLQTPATVDGPVRNIQWCSLKSLMAVNTVTNVYILSEHVMSSSFGSQTAVVQYAPTSLAIQFFSSGTHQDLKTDIQVKGVFTTKDAVAVWNGKRVIIYEFSSDKSTLKAAGMFLTDALEIVIYEQNVYIIEQNKVQVRTFQGTVKQLITFAEPEGRPVSLDVCGQYLAIATDLGIVRVYDLSRREAKAHTIPKSISDAIPGFGTVISAKVNSAGSRVSMLVKMSDGMPDPKLYFWDIELDTVHYFNFETGRGEDDDYPAASNPGQEEDLDTNDAERGKYQAAKDIAGRFPVSHFWDSEEAKLLVCEAKVLPKQSGKDAEVKKQHSLTKAVEEGPVDKMVVSLFCSSEHGVLIQDSFAIPAQYTFLLGVEVPYHYFIKKSMDTQSSSNGQVAGEVLTAPEAGAFTYPKLVARKVMRDFVGLESSDSVTRDAMMNFSYHLTTGNMDEAFKAIKLIKR